MTKSAENMDRKMREKGYHKSRKVERKYQELLTKRAQRELTLNEISALNAQINELEFKISTYNSTFSDADEFNLSITDLNNSLQKLNSENAKLHKRLKSIEKI